MNSINPCHALFEYIMNSERKEIDLWADQSSAWYLLRTHGRQDLVEDLLQSGSWREFSYRRTPTPPFRLSAWRFDFGLDPAPFRDLMEKGRIVALFCKESSGDPLIASHPIAAYKQENRNKIRYACLYVLDEVAPGRIWRAKR